MELFDKRFVYLEWDDCLEGKKVIVGDLLQLMRRNVNDNAVKLRCVEDNGSNSDLYLFRDECGTEWSLVYYDPNYECKLAYEQGKVIEARSRGSSDENAWYDVGMPNWLDSQEYRVRPEKPDCYILSMSHAPSSILSIDKNIYPVENKLILSKGTEEECKDYAVENYCKKCIHEVSICCSPRLGCQGFKEECDSLYVYKCSDDTLHISKYNYRDFLFEGTEAACEQYIKEHYCARCIHQSCDMVTGTQFCKGFKEVKKRRKTNRELAQWVSSGYGECMCNGIVMTDWQYVYDAADMPVKDGVYVRGWDEIEWHEPEIK